MNIFKRKQKGYLGIDLGAGGIKVVQLTPADGQGALFTYGFCERPVQEISADYIEDLEKAGAFLKAVCDKAKITVTRAVAALPIPTVFSAVLAIGLMSKKELPQAVQWEAKKLIPLPLEEVTIDYKELAFARASADDNKKTRTQGTKKGGAEKSTQVLLTAAPKSIIDKYIVIAKHAGLTLDSLETEAFALIRSLIGNDPTPSVIVDIGAVRSNILIVDRGIPMLTRSIETGGKNCTEAIANSLGVDLAQAEAMKRDLSVKHLGQELADSPLPLVREALQPLINELRYSLNIYRTRNVIARPPERIILTGGGSAISGLAESFTQEFNLRSFAGNPWNRVNFHSDLDSLLQTFGSRFSVAIGLALRNL